MKPRTFLAATLALCGVGLLGYAALSLVKEPAAAVAGPGGRMLSVRWLGVAEKGLPVEVAPLQGNTAVPLGGKGKVVFRFFNRSERTVRFQAVHHVAPGPAQEHFKKYECFCFKQQTLGPGERKELPVGYRFDDALPSGVNKITVSYRLLPLTAGSEAGHQHPDGFIHDLTQ